MNVANALLEGAAPANVRSSHMLRFGRFELDPVNCRLLRDGREVLLKPRTFELLSYLALHPGRLIRKEELLERVWSAQILSDGVLSNTVAQLRKALGQRAHEREPIETLYGRGYRFHAVVEVVALPPSAAMVPPRQPPTAATLPADPFVGRGSVLTLLDAQLARAQAGRGLLLMVAGEAGIGKSRTLSELAERARRLGFSVWQGACHADAAAPAYWPFIEVVRAAHAELGSQFHEHVPADAWALAHWLPELMQATPRESDPSVLRFRLFDELTRFLGSACRGAPRLIVLEDLHAADAPTLELLGHVASAPCAQPLLVAASLRAHELARDDTRARALRRCLRHAEYVELLGLPGPEVADLVARLGAVPGEGFCELLCERTQGNPFFIRQLLSLLQQHDKPLTCPQLRAADLPPAVRGVLAQRLLGLPSQVRSLLAAAAVIGESFDAALLAELQSGQSARGRGLDHVLALLEPALAMGLLRASDAKSHHRFRFGHGLLRDTLYDDLSLLERGRLHARLWQLLAANRAGDDAQELAEIARHALRAVPFELESCIAHCLEAARSSHQASGFEVAAELLERALDKLAAEGGRAELRCQLLLQLGMSQMCAGEVAAALRTHERGARLASELRDAAWLARFIGRLAGWLDIGGSRTDVCSLLADTLARGPAAAPAPQAILLAQHAAIGEGLDHSERARLLDQAASLARECEPEVQLEVAVARVNVRDVLRREESEGAVAAYLELAERHRHATDAGQYRLRGFSAALTDYLCALTAGEPTRMRETLAHCRSVADASYVPPLQQAAEVLRTGYLLATGRLDEVEQAVERLRRSTHLAGGLGLVWIWYELQLLASRGDGASLDHLSAWSDRSVLQHIAPRQRAASLIGAARAIAKAGFVDVARDLMNGAALQRRDLERLPEQYGDLGLLCSLVELRWQLHDHSDLELLECQLAPHAALNAVGVAFDYSGSVAHYLGMLSLMRGRSEEAMQRLRLALEHNRRLDMPLQLAWTSELLARAQRS